ncbi:guanine nucleotide-binding protein subunit alpha [Dinochytrium kinnereticum]|nr:guanine nucleotide-binding protein subunit alpha [Dinochytrium kinnereticum]
MGNSCSSTPEELEANVKSKEIDRVLRSEKKEADEVIKLLLLGSGESGKSTVLKQFRLIHGMGFSDQERLAFRPAILANVIRCGKDLVHAMEMLDIPYNSAADAAISIKSAPLAYGEGEIVPELLRKALEALWADPGVQQCFLRANQDILASRVMTTTVTETRVQIEGITFKIFDVGGQRSERKKWAPYFDDVMALIFVSAVSSFDQTCFEDSKTNRTVILFLNKIDLFKRKLKTTQISKFFEDYQGDNTFDDASEYFATKFLSLNRNREKKIYVHLTWATDSNQIRAVLRTVNTIVLK